MLGNAVQARLSETQWSTSGDVSRETRWRFKLGHFKASRAVDGTGEEDIVKFRPIFLCFLLKMPRGMKKKIIDKAVDNVGTIRMSNSVS